MALRLNRHPTTPPLHAAAFSLQSVSPSLPTSARNAESLPDFEVDHGWRESIQKEITRVAMFKAMEVVSEKEYHLSLNTHGYDKVSVGNFVLAFRIKTDPDGGLLDATKCLKSRLTFADRRSQASQAALNYYSACVSSSSSRLISQLAVEHGAFQHTIDVSGAYYKGTRPSVAEGGRLVYARVPAWLSNYGPYPTQDTNGSPNYIWITGNMTG